MRALIGAAVLVALASCARTGLDTEPSMGGDAQAPVAKCTSSSGVRVCGGPPESPQECPSLDVGACPGYGCTPLIDFDGNASSVGICWADSAETDWLCDGCNIGDGCLQRKPGEWVCVPIDVCETLWNDGVRNVCRYADKTRYDDRAIPQGSGCPLPASTPNYTYYACGGDCPHPCGSAQRCNGVAPDHPFGLCNGGPGLGGAYNSSFSCGTSPPCNGFSPDYLCAVPNVPNADIDVARGYGVCMPKANCFDFASSFPGGLGCYDAAGNRLK